MPARALRLSDRFIAAIRRHRVGPETVAGRALFALLTAMLSAELPGTQDAETQVPPVHRYWFRRVGHLNLWVYFAFSDSTLTAVNLTDRPPIPID